ncbi:MAG: tRNA (N6-isopentenyl adenosine(37)-C2)-methylthiotransferase MiaB [SAR202 cluster bacterium]|jgi:tRNA-2-methylthio-N6-dimethylallyladenosine synthase|nr:tRNA (N6-isopentenyl adenosine(37)-C2)-methylthiotransferase MiaB [SAR202 cluster bacterium]MDP6512196.1 tRNA (N6-isopentenyl adenosine(37)-C2)-methylthiotransferase MiaB [SAR202 cluster bacterium]MDP6715421.1 tRNA (N6-isopentenyl adenosine(37)-C2)-methylthiotransferase MiaB [SAR202 cluster bacterium]
MESYYIWTVGCQMNKADSERMESALGQMGLGPTDAPHDADVIVLNSCVVRESAEDRVIGMLTSLKPVKQKDPNKVVALMGCMVGPQTKTLQKRYPYVDAFMQPQQFGQLLEIVGERIGVDPEGCVGPLTANAGVATYIPIIHGCDKFCAFCIIPYRRGREESRPVDEIVHEARMLARRGVKEITLLGQNVDSYGHDLPGSVDLGNLLSAVNEVEELERVRFLTSHPYDMSDHIIDTIAQLDKVCEHVNLPFQAGDDQVLTNMRRGYSNDDYRAIVEKIRKRIPNVSLATDLIVGFSGETEPQFQRTLEMVRDIRFDKVHSAAYSTRPGTIAARMMDDDVPHEEKKRRLNAIDTLQESVSAEINLALQGTTQEILVEGQKRGRWFGRTRNDKLVYFDDEINRSGEMVKVRIEQAGSWSLQGALTV